MPNTDDVQDRGEVHIPRPNSIYYIEMALEEINSHIKYVVYFFILCSIAGVFNAWHILVSNYYAYVPPHWCRIPELEAVGWTADQIRAISSNKSTESSCFMIGWNYTLFAELGYEKSQEFISNSTFYPEETPCKKFFYDESAPSSTVVAEWDLVCDRKAGKSHVQGSIAFGKLIGAFLFGIIADKFGRKPTFLVCCLIYFVFGVSSALTDIFWVFLITRSFAGIAGVGCYETGFTLLEELISKRHRAVLGCMYNVGYPIGFITLPGLSMMFTNWRHLQLAISVPLVVFIPHIWLLPESPRWYFVHGLPEKAWKTIKKFNKNSVVHNSSDTVQGTSQQLSKFTRRVLGKPEVGNQVQEIAETIITEPNNRVRERVLSPSTISISDKLAKDIKAIFLLFSTCELCKRICISMFNFFVAALVYYTIALNARDFGVNMDWYLFIAGWVSIPGYIFPIFIMLCMGRKWASTLLFLLTGLTLVIINFFSKDQKYAILFFVMVGKFTNVAVFGLVTVYCAELFPTVVRNSAVGVSLAISQLGSIFAPYIIDFLGPYGWYIPSTICGVHSIAAAVLILLLPETKGKALPNTIYDIKNQPEKVSLRNCCKFS